jgi:hypothetical protein
MSNDQLALAKSCLATCETLFQLIQKYQDDDTLVDTLSSLGAYVADDYTEFFSQEGSQ